MHVYRAYLLNWLLYIAVCMFSYFHLSVTGIFFRVTAVRQ